MSHRNPWQERVDAYVAERRRDGFKLSIDATQLAGFARFVHRIGHRGPLTVELASGWALASRRGTRLTAARRIEVLRGFTRYCQQLDPATQVPPRGLFGPAHRRLTPHIYTDAEISSLLAAAARLPPLGGLRAANCTTFLGLIAATGLRISEAAGLRRSDVDLEQGLLLVRHAKFGKTRWVPLHPTTVEALERYVRRRDRQCPGTAKDAFFVRSNGADFLPKHARHAFKQLRQALGWRPRGGHPAPRIQDLRHRFVCRRLCRWYRAGKDIDQHILALSTYVGHVKVTDTYWYVTATAELMAMAARRSEHPSRGGVR
jgi:integrase